MITLALLVPTAMLDGVTPNNIGSNFQQGADCQFGITPSGHASCSGAPYATHAYIVINVLWNVVGLFVISTLGANAFTIVSTATVPLNALVYAIPGMPAYKPASGWTAGGLLSVLAGVAVFQYYSEMRQEAMARIPLIHQWCHAVKSRFWNGVVERDDSASIARIGSVYQYQTLGSPNPQPEQVPSK